MTTNHEKVSMSFSKRGYGDIILFLEDQSGTKSELKRLDESRVLIYPIVIKR